MKAERLITYYDHHFNAAIQQLELYKQKSRPEALHQFRVNIKKTRAVFKMLKGLQPGKKLKRINHSVRLIFWKAGDVRDLQLKTAWLKRSRKKELLVFFKLEEELRDADAHFKKDIPHYENEMQELAQQALPLAENVMAQDVQAYFGKLVLHVKLTVTELPPHNEWHQLRKNIKQVLYSLHWLEETITLRLQKSLLIKTLDQLQDGIGHWHDEMLLKEWLGEKQAFLSEDTKVVQQFDVVWKKLVASLLEHEKAIKKLFTRINRMKFVSLREQ